MVDETINLLKQIICLKQFTDCFVIVYKQYVKRFLHHTIFCTKDPPFLKQFLRKFKSCGPSYST